MELSRLRIVFALVLAALAGAWLLSLSPGALTEGFWRVRGTLVYGTGVLAIGAMSVAVILAARPVQIESALGGLDKFYRLHKWLGITALVAAVAHYLAENAPRWLVQAGWLEPRQRRAGGQPAAAATGFDPFRDLHGIAGDVGEWAFYLLVVLVLLALWKRVPYRYFFKAHRLMAPVYLALVFHAVILLDRSYWTAPVGLLLAILMAGGTVAATVALFRRIGYSRRATGTVSMLKRYFDNSVLDVGIQLETAWPGHQAGQFAFVTFDKAEGAHPFTISSAWQEDGKLVFSIKGLGDYTRLLPDQLRIGQAVTIEGPYGRFHFKGERPRQIWVAGGVGITPFIARLQALAGGKSGGDIDLIYSTSAPDGTFIDNIRALAADAGVRFHLLVSPRDGYLTLDRLAEMVPEWASADLWFCGPAGFGRDLRGAMTARGFDAAHFHQELFEMR